MKLSISGTSLAHPAAAKSLGFAKSANGIVGLETAVPITYGVMVEEEGMPVEDWARAWSELPRAIVAGLGGVTLPETVLTVGEERTVDVGTFLSLSRNGPYHGLKGRCWPCR